MRRWLHILAGVLLGLPMALPLLLLIASLLGGLAGFWWARDLLTLSPEAKWIVAYPLKDAQGNERWVSAVIYAKEGPKGPVAEEFAQMMEQGDIRADVALYLGPEDFKLFRGHLDVHIPIKELLEGAFGEGPPRK